MALGVSESVRVSAVSVYTGRVHVQVSVGVCMWECLCLRVYIFG